MSKKGWISVHREIYENWVWKENEPFDKRSAWIDLLLMANHKDNTIIFDGELLEVKRGQRITSIRKLSERWKWSKTKVKNFLVLLEKDRMILLEIVPHKRTVITIVNYDKYQDTRDSKNTSDVPVKGQSSTSEVPVEYLNNNDNNDNNENNDDNSPELQNFISKFNSILGLKESSSSNIKFIFNMNLEKHGAEIFEKALAEIEKSDYLKTCNSLNWFLMSIENIVDGKYRNRDKVSEKKNGFNNFTGQGSSYSAEDLDRIAREQTKRRNEQI